MNRLFDQLPAISGVKTETLFLDEPFEEMAARFANESNTVVLLSGGELDCSCYHILALRPWLVLSGRLGRTSIVVDNNVLDAAQAPLDALQCILRRCRLNDVRSASIIEAGLFGYLAYDLKDHLEDLPRTTIDDTGLPHLWFAAPSLIVVQELASGSTQIHAPIRSDRNAADAREAIGRFRKMLTSPSLSSKAFTKTGPPLGSNFSQPEYEGAVKRIKEYIAAGDVYQVNLSQRFTMGFTGDGYSLFRTLYRLNPAPFFAYIDAGDHKIVSTSPERFLLRSGQRVETRPIKGTRPRGETPEQDRQMKAALAASPKDDAELSMIVDLLRNDIGKVCTGGSVVVRQHKRLEAYQNVYHLVSVVAGVLAEDKDSVDLIRATFPGGSITGCPKIRAMEIIDELETCRRHVYTGSIGYISFHDTLDLSIAIRTATIVGERLFFSVGGGIVFDSNPQDEYEETLHKGRTLISVFQRQASSPDSEAGSQPWVWHNGRLVCRDQATVPVSDLGLQYGFGFFETIRVENGFACRLGAHVARFNRSWRKLFGSDPPDLTWKDILARVVEKNRLGDTAAAVKILATRGDDSRAGFNGTVLVTARPYVHRLAGLKATGLTLVTYPHPRMTPLAEHKTLNYLYYLQAGVWAREQGADEAIIVNPDRSISETNTANILVVSGKMVFCPVSTHVLSGVMQGALTRRLEAMGFAVVDRPLRPDDLMEADAVLLTNALMGAVPALSLNQRPLKVDTALIDSLNRRLFTPEEGDDGL